MTTRTQALVLAIMFLTMGLLCLLLNLIRPCDTISIFIGCCAIGIGIFYFVLLFRKS